MGQNPLVALQQTGRSITKGSLPIQPSICLKMWKKYEGRKMEQQTQDVLFLYSLPNYPASL